MHLLALLLACSPRATDPTPEDSDAPPAPPPPLCEEYGEAEAVAEVADASLEEISGLVASRTTPGAWWVLEDSSNPAALTALSEEGEVLAAVSVEGADNLDWEDLAAGPCPENAGGCLYIGDIGDNAEAREDIQVLRLAEPALTDATPASVEATTLTLRYEDGPHNAESMVVTPEGALWIITKGEDPALYVLDALAEGGVLERRGAVDTVPEGGSASQATLPTGASLSEDGRRLALRTYGALWLFDATAAGELSARRSLPAAVERQGEAVGFSTTEDALWHVSEGENAALYRLACEDPGEAARRRR